MTNHYIRKTLMRKSTANFIFKILRQILSDSINNGITYDTAYIFTFKTIQIKELN